MPSIGVTVVGGLLAVAPILSAQTVPTRTVQAAPATLSDGFTHVTSVNELRDGRVLVADARDRALRIADFRTGALIALGRQGQGPNEYSGIGPISRVGDTLYMVDFAPRRALRITRTGELAGSRPIELSIDALPGPGPENANRVMGTPRFLDQSGGLYLEVSYLRLGSGVLTEGAYVARVDAAGRVTRAAPLQMWYPERSTRWRAPFMAGDVWAVAPDGRVARVSPSPYRVEWYRNGQLLARGSEVPVRPIEVTAADRRAWHEARARQRPGGATVTGPTPKAGTSGGARRTPRTPGVSDTDFPRHFPPFVESYVGHVAMIAPDGALWVMRYVPPRDVPMADVFDADGRLTLRVMLPRGRRVAGFGDGRLYLVYTDADGLQWLERYPWQ